MNANVPQFQDDEKKRIVQTKIEAQLYLNLQLAHESDQLSCELNQLFSSFECRHQFIEEQLKLECESDVVIGPIVSEDSNEEICASPRCMSCPDCVAPAPAHVTQISSEKFPSSKNRMFKSGHGFDSDSSLPDSDSAVSSMSSADFQRNCAITELTQLDKERNLAKFDNICKAEVKGHDSKVMRETLV